MIRSLECVFRACASEGCALCGGSAAHRGVRAGGHVERRGPRVMGPPDKSCMRRILVVDFDGRADVVPMKRANGKRDKLPSRPAC